MKKFIKRILFIGAISFILIKGSNIYASTSANITTYEINTEEITLDTERIINMGTMQYSKPSSVYDFMDEDGMYNSVYTSENNVYWTTFDSQMNAIKTRKIPMYFDKSNSSDFMKDLVFNFGNALYYNENLYIVYGREGYTATSDGFWNVTMAIVKYDKEGNQIAKNDLVGTQLNPTNHWNLGGGDWTYGTYLPFYPNSNCSLTISNGVIACFFGRQMYISHSSSMMFFIDADSLEFVSNKYYTSDENAKKYEEPGGYYTSHSMGQRIIGTSDGGYISAELGDAGTLGATRGLMISKIYPQEEILKVSKNKMLHFSEGGMGSNGYNYTYSSLGNIIELSDGYMYIGSMEPTLSLEYGNSINESWNIFAQKYKPNFWEEDSIGNMQVFNTYVREAQGTPPEDAELGVNAPLGRLYLTGDEKDYGIKWLTDFNNEYMTLLVRAVEIEDENIVILYEQLPIEKNEDESRGYSLSSTNGDVYYMIIDKDANIICNPVKVDGVKLNEEELYSYNDGKIYWTTANGNQNKITINVLDISESISKPSEQIEKGDLDRNGAVNSDDAAIALDLYRYGNVSDEDLQIGDMDENGLINSDDAALILDVYRYGK